MIRPPSVPETLVVTVDVECDSDGGPTWRNSDPLRFEGVRHGLGEVLHQIIDDVEGSASLLVSNVVLGDERSVALLKDLPRVELGAHLHGDFLPPDPRVPDPAGAMASENQCDYQEQVERAKLAELGRMFEDAFGKRATSFRAGRWSASGRTVRLLSEMGYEVDSSVSPLVRWTDGGRSVDFRRAPQQPYRPSSEDITSPGDLPIWELPVSIVARWWMPGRPLWLRPSLSSAAGMQRVVRALRTHYESPRVYVLMFHNNELTPSSSPYSRSKEDAVKVARSLRAFLRWARDEGMAFATLSEAARGVAS